MAFGLALTESFDAFHEVLVHFLDLDWVHFMDTLNHVICNRSDASLLKQLHVLQQGGNSLTRGEDLAGRSVDDEVCYGFAEDFVEEQDH